MTNSPMTLQDLRRRIYVKAKAETSWRFCSAKASAGSDGVDGGSTKLSDSLAIIGSVISRPRRQWPQQDRSHNP